MLAILKKHWLAATATVVTLLPLSKALLYLLDWGGRLDLVLSKYNAMGGMSGLIEFFLNPPPWIIFPALAIGAALLVWDRRKVEAPAGC